MQTTTQYVASCVRAEMARRGITQAQLAAPLGITISQVSKRLRGRIEFGVNELQTVADVLGVDIASLLPTPPEAIAQ